MGSGRLTRSRVRAALPIAIASIGLAACRPAAVGRAEPSPSAVGAAVAGTVRRDAAPAGLRGTPRLRAHADSLVHAPMFAAARWGLLVVDLDTRDTLLALDERKLFMPASNMKLVSGAVTLTELGPAFRWRTPVLRDANGRLHVIGAGDPSWSVTFHDTVPGPLDAFAPIADALRARGIARVTDVVVHAGVFPDAPLGYGWAWDDLDFAYSAGADGVMLDDNVLTLRVRAGDRAGAPVAVHTGPVPSDPRVLSHAVTGARGDTTAPPLEAGWDSTAQRLVVRGTLPAGATRTLLRAERHPADAVRLAVIARLREAGVTVEASSVDATSGGRVDPAPSAMHAGAAASATTTVIAGDTLTVLVSPPLDSLLPAMLKPSQNQLAETFFKTVALRVAGTGTADSARAVTERRLAAWGIDSTQAAVRDGSGLSRHDYLSPAALVRVLEVMAAGPHAEHFADALPVAGVDGTIQRRLRGTPAEGNARAKTGTLDKVRTLSGYVTDARGHRLAFSLLCNNHTVPNREVERVQDAIVAALAAYDGAEDGATRLAPGTASGRAPARPGGGAQ